MKLNHKVTAGGKEWTIRTVRKPQFKGEEVRGYAYFPKREIRISESLKDEEMIEIVLHEVMHVQCPYLTEEVVEESAEETRNILAELGLI